MGKLISLFFFLLISLTHNTNAQVDNVTGQYVDRGNILLSPGAESGLKGWTNSAGTLTVESTGAIVGQRVFKVVLSNQTLNFRQDSTKYASEYADGVQLLGYARIKTSVSGVKLCPRKAGVTQTSLCVSHTGSGKWELLKIPFISGVTSNGLAIITDSNKSGTVYVDDTFLGAQDVKQDTDNISDWISYTPTGSWTSNTTYSGFWRRVGSDIELDVNLTLTGAPNAANLTFSIPSGYTIDTSKLAGNTITSFGHGLGINAGNALIFSVGSITSNSFTVFHTTSLVGGLSIVNATSPVTWASGNTIHMKAKFPIVGWSSSGSIYSSTNANYDWTSYTPTLSGNTNFGCNLQHMRSGSSMKIKGTCTWTGVGNTSPPRITLPNSLLTSFDDGTHININKAFDAGIQDYGVIAYVSGTSGISFKRQYIPTATNGTPIGTDNSFPFTPNSGDTLVINVEVPISTFENSNVIIGQFNGLESCASAYECESTYSAKVSSAGAVSGENIDWINGNVSSITDTSLFNIGFKSGVFTVSPNCMVTINTGTTNAIAQMDGAATTSGISIRTMSSTTKTPFGFEIICQKQGVDYVAKSARAVFQTGALYSSPTVLNQGATGANTFDTGTYTPTNFGTNTNVTSLQLNSDSQFKYLRIGNILYVSGRYIHNVSVTNNFGYTISLPSFVTNNFVNSGDCSGTSSGENVGSGGIRVGAIIASQNGFRVVSGYSDVGGSVIMNLSVMCILR